MHVVGEMENLFSFSLIQSHTAWVCLAQNFDDSKEDKTDFQISLSNLFFFSRIVLSTLSICDNTHTCHLSPCLAAQSKKSKTGDIKKKKLQ